MRDSIFLSSIRSFFVAFFAIIGIGLGFIVFFMLIGALVSSVSTSNTTNLKIPTDYTPKIVANADWQREEQPANAPAILQLNIKGIIGMEGLTTDNIRQVLIESREGDLKDDRLKAILLYIDTPGGTVTDSDGIYRALLEYKNKFKTPIYAYVDGLCTSGGMYIACAADKIFASNASLIGSVGVMAPTFINVSKVLDRWGVDTLNITAGKDKDALNPLRPWEPGEDENYRQAIDFYYRRFVDIVTSHRQKMNKEKLIKDYGAHIFPSPEALERGYIDVTDASRDQALKALVKDLGIEDDSYQVVELQSKEWWSNLFSSSFWQGKIKHQIELTPRLETNKGSLLAACLFP
jgi:protease IV